MMHPVLSSILPPHPLLEELPFPLWNPLPSEGFLCCLQLWDVAETPRRELTPRTGCESGIPASRWKHPPLPPQPCGASQLQIPQRGRGEK